MEDRSYIFKIGFASAVFALAIMTQLAVLSGIGSVSLDKFESGKPGSLLLAGAIVLTAWVFALVTYFYFFTPVGDSEAAPPMARNVPEPRLPTPVGNVPEPRLPAPAFAHVPAPGLPAPVFAYVPGDDAYETILDALLSLSVTGAAVDAGRLDWIEALDAQWTKISPSSRRQMNRASLVKAAELNAADGPARTLASLARRRDKLNDRDKEILVKFCILLATANGPLSEADMSLIMDMTEAIGLPRERLLEL